MERCKKVRTPLRAAFTRTYNDIVAELAKEEKDVMNVRVKMDKLKRVITEIRCVDQSILDNLLDTDCSQESYDEEKQGIEDYEDKFSLIQFKVMAVLPVSRPNSPTVSISTNNAAGDGLRKTTFKLPKIEIRKYNGDLKEWLGWWTQFEKIHEDPDLHESDKFQYLVQAMVPGTRASQLVASYPQTTDNYPKVIQSLKERFGKEKLLMQVYVRELLKLVIHKATAKQAVKVSNLFDKLEAHIRALASLGITTEMMAVFLYPMIESSLSEDLLVAWQRSPLNGCDGSQELPPKTELDFLMQFLKKEVENEDQRELVQTGFSQLQPDEKKRVHWKDEKIISKGEKPTAAGLLASVKSNCVFCDRSHESKECGKAQGMSFKEKQDIIRKCKACFSCLRLGHGAKRCKAFIKCLICGKKHVVLMCPDLPANKSPLNGEEDNSPINFNNQSSTVASSLNVTTEVYLQTLVVGIGKKGARRKTARLLFDSGSQLSYILDNTAKELGYKPISQVDLRHILFGGVCQPQEHNQYLIDLHTISGDFCNTVKLLGHRKICGAIPRMRKGPWMSELDEAGIELSDVGCGQPHIEILIGADYSGLFLTGNLLHLSNGLTAVETRLGWSVMGRLKETEPSMGLTVLTMFVGEASLSELWSLDAIGIREPAEQISKEEKELTVKQHFKNTVTRDTDGRYSVSLPWIGVDHNIPTNRVVAEKRLISTTRKLESQRAYEQYDEVFKSWLKEGIIQEVSESSGTATHYLPHRPIFKPDSQTTPVRPVFDASCKLGRSPSLNDCLETGPNLLELIPTVLLRFREKEIGVTADIRRAFQMINIKPADQDYLRFLWWRNPVTKEIKEYRHTLVVFGVRCSPFMLAAVIELHLQSVDTERKPIADQLLKSLYVDNCVTSVSTYKNYRKFKTQATGIMSEAKMELRQWQYGTDQTPGVGLHSDCRLGRGGSTALMNLEDTHQDNVLGLKWNRSTDTLSCAVKAAILPSVITKRTVLSMVQKVFDPIGFTCPIMLQPKLVLRQAWQAKVGWDEELPETIATKFLMWSDGIRHLGKIEIPRYVALERPHQSTLHTFCDASKDAYAAVVYVRTVKEDGVVINLLQAKARLSPVRKITIPRLELLGCLIGARLANSVKNALELCTIPAYYWSDSSTALAWIKKNDDWGTFVGNRVKEILLLSDAKNWHHVPGIQNPADLPSRGCTLHELRESKWWEGPVWLKKSECEWPDGIFDTDEDAIASEKRAKAILLSTALSQWYVPKFSSYLKNIRVMGWIGRFLKNLREDPAHRTYAKHLTITELRQAETHVVKLIQELSFDRGKTGFKGICVEKRQDGLIHVRTKLLNMTASEGFRWPLLLPGKHALVDQLIAEVHRTNGHAGVQFVLGKLREKYWVLQGRRAIKRIIHRCIVCRKFDVKAFQVDPAALPEKRMVASYAFQTTGVDLAGPLFLRDGSKAWIVLFTCAVYRCVQLDLVGSLSTEVFLGALERFINIFGRPNTIYSDNGTNFVGAVNVFKRINWKKVQEVSNVKQIQWIFNPPTAAWWGGWWERLVRSTKNLLKRMLGTAKLTFEELRI